MVGESLHTRNCQRVTMLGRLRTDVVGTAAFLYLTFWRHSTITMRLREASLLQLSMGYHILGIQSSKHLQL